MTTAAARDPGTRSSALLTAETETAAKAPPRPELRSNCNSQRRPAMGKEAKERARLVTGGALMPVLIGSRSWRREAVFGQASPRSWESEMEGCVSNLMVCNLAYSGKLEELKERILADKSLATRTDQVKQRLGPLHWRRRRQRRRPTWLPGPAQPMGRPVPRGPDPRPRRPILTPGSPQDSGPGGRS